MQNAVFARFAVLQKGIAHLRINAAGFPFSAPRDKTVQSGVRSGLSGRQTQPT
jgi:hypothetical protein